jgi:AcrR family transcriptional regulator
MPKQVATEQEWIALGLQLFSTGGEQSLVVEQLAKLLGSSKTSFYWYFKSRPAFVQRIVEYWRELATTSIISHIEANRNAAPIDQAAGLLSFMFGSVQGKNFMHHLRVLGQSEPRYQQILQEIEEQRLAYMAGLLVRCGYAEKAAECMSQLIYCYYLGWYERNKYLPLTERETSNQVELLLGLIKQSI